MRRPQFGQTGFSDTRSLVLKRYPSKRRPPASLSVWRSSSLTSLATNASRCQSRYHGRSAAIVRERKTLSSLKKLADVMVQLALLKRPRTDRKATLRLPKRPKDLSFFRAVFFSSLLAPRLIKPDFPKADALIRQRSGCFMKGFRTCYRFLALPYQRVRTAHAS